LLLQARDFWVFAAAATGVQSGNRERSRFGHIWVVVIVYRPFKATD
jgi:hypothetical protein